MFDGRLAIPASHLISSLDHEPLAEPSPVTAGGAADVSVAAGWRVAEVQIAALADVR